MPVAIRHSDRHVRRAGEEIEAVIEAENRDMDLRIQVLDGNSGIQKNFAVVVHVGQDDRVRANRRDDVGPRREVLCGRIERQPHRQPREPQQLCEHPASAL